MSKDEYLIAKTKAEKFCDDLLDTAGRALVSGILKPGDRETLFRAKMAVENGMRDLTRIVDQSNFGTLGYEAMQQIVRGAFHIGCCAVYPDSHKVFIDRQKSSRGGKKGSIGRIEKKELWQCHVRDRVAEQYRENPNKKGTVIRESIKKSIKKTRPPGICLPNDRDLYEFILAELKALKQGIK
jgi:hypothetical protein